MNRRKRKLIPSEVRERLLRLKQDGWCGSDSDMDDLEMLQAVAEDWLRLKAEKWECAR